MVGKTLQKYEILEEIGQGGMAVVFRGRDQKLDREVAVKVLHSHLASREESLERFRREAQAVARLRHDNILQIYDYSGKESAESFIVMEFIHGPTLKDFLEKHPVSVPEVGVMMVVELCGALSHAHAAGIIHRDIKPENIMVRDDGLLKLTDFGIAAMVDTQKLTVTGQLLGSPAYMAPEMVTGERLDFRTDVFSLGILLYRLTVGELPFKGKNPHEVLKRIAEVDYIPASIANPRVGEELARILERALARRPQDRYESVEALRSALMAELEVVALSDPRKELREFFADPEGYQERLGGHIVSALIQVSRVDIRRGQHARAFSRLNRVFALEPENEEVQRLLRTLGRDRKLRAAGKAFLLVALVVAAGGALWWGVDRLRPLSEQPTRHVALLSRDAAATASMATDGAAEASRPDEMRQPRDASARRAEDGLAHSDARPAPGPTPRRRPPRPGMTHRQMRTLRLQVMPLIWRLYVDGKRVSRAPGTPASIQVGPGEHTLEFRDESGSAYSWRYRVTERQGDHTVRHRLRWHPARLLITGSPKDANVQFLSPAYLARRAPAPIEVPIVVPIVNPGEGGVKATVRVYRTGYHATQRTVRFWPNKTLRLRVRLKPLR